AKTVVDFVVGTGEFMPASEMRVFPNPTSGQLYFDLPNMPDERFDVFIFDTEGKLLLQKPLSHSVRSMQLEGLPEGILWVKVAGKEKEFFGKVVYKK
ncbi:MAG: T9SS type A sorting domain-containing protein, partial [Saprospiraceae bacterium]|nr:T9SS type A sorting domain-containing protein [Saprospiraceae bacterium]